MRVLRLTIVLDLFPSGLASAQQNAVTLNLQQYRRQYSLNL